MPLLDFKQRKFPTEFDGVFELLSVLLVLVLLSSLSVEGRKAQVHHYFEYSAMSCRANSASLTDFGGVGDGTTLNTEAFRAAITHLSQFESDGGSQLFVPPGNWLTGSFNLTSHFTLYLDKDAVLLASQELSRSQKQSNGKHLLQSSTLSGFSLAKAFCSQNFLEPLQLQRH